MSRTTLKLGYAVGSGERVEIPLKHMAVTGQTQEAGKTTTLEGLIHRGTEQGLRALAFVTKRGEGAFDDGRLIPPYFRDDAGGRPYWEFVESMAGAAMGGQKMKFERAWIVKASRAASSLQDVRKNLTRLQGEAKRSMDQDIYMLLAEYLDIVIPQLRTLPRATSIELQPGLNVMDLTGFTDELQALVVRSALMWVHAHEKNTITVIPEAWKFIPEGRLTPVKPIAERLIREGAGLRNFVWIDSQDIAGVWKLMLRAAAVWLVGVQREANEIKRTLESIPAGVKRPKPGDVATLDRGQFFSCWGTHVVKTYVQPAWMGDAGARDVALGRVAVDDAPRGKRDTKPANRETRPAARETSRAIPETNSPHGEMGGTVTEREAAELRQENADLKAHLHNLQVELDRLRRAQAAGPPALTSHPYPGPDDTISIDALYDQFKRRLIEDAPAIIRVMADRPSVEVTIRRPVLEFDEHSMKWRLTRLLAEGFFSTEPKSCSQIRTALKRVGPDANTANIGRTMDDLVKAGVFTDEGSGYRAVPGLKPVIKEA